ncbi:MAG TPA: hypothetical protein VI522_06745, partial [Gammaproteobacteria bacterium]|nr:hypothetical protein [Gammaproteobacteria bacterium]
MKRVTRWFIVSLWAGLLAFSALVQAQLPDFTHLSKELSATVVNISSTRSVTSSPPQYRFQGAPDEFQDMLEQFFGTPMNP